MTTYFIFKNDLEKRVEEELNQVNDSTYKLIETSINTAIRAHLRVSAEKTRDLVENIHLLYKKGRITGREADARIRDIILAPNYSKIGKTGYLNVSDMEGNLLVHPYREGENISHYEFMKTGIKEKSGYTEYARNPGPVLYFFTFFAKCVSWPIVL
ncbi:MAG: hypothetical protein GY950_29550 [bacterium]|nr:hypothetical protein [bacterium]